MLGLEASCILLPSSGSPGLWRKMHSNTSETALMHCICISTFHISPKRDKPSVCHPWSSGDFSGSSLATCWVVLQFAVSLVEALRELPLWPPFFVTHTFVDTTRRQHSLHLHVWRLSSIYPAWERLFCLADHRLHLSFLWQAPLSSCSLGLSLCSNCKYSSWGSSSGVVYANEDFHRVMSALGTLAPKVGWSTGAYESHLDSLSALVLFFRQRPYAHDCFPHSSGFSEKVEGVAWPTLSCPAFRRMGIFLVLLLTLGPIVQDKQFTSFVIPLPLRLLVEIWMRYCFACFIPSSSIWKEPTRRDKNVGTFPLEQVSARWCQGAPSFRLCEVTRWAYAASSEADLPSCLRTHEVSGKGPPLAFHLNFPGIKVMRKGVQCHQTTFTSF